MGRREYVSCTYLPIVVTLCDSCVLFSGCLQKRIESLLFHPAADNVRHTHTHTHTHTHMHTHTHTCVRTHTHTHACAHTHTHTHLRTYTCITQIGEFLEQ